MGKAGLWNVPYPRSRPRPPWGAQTGCEGTGVRFSHSQQGDLPDSGSRELCGRSRLRVAHWEPGGFIMATGLWGSLRTGVGPPRLRWALPGHTPGDTAADSAGRGGRQPRLPEERRQGCVVWFLPSPYNQSWGDFIRLGWGLRTGMRRSVKVEGEAQYCVKRGRTKSATTCSPTQTQGAGQPPSPGLGPSTPGLFSCPT